MKNEFAPPQLPKDSIHFSVARLLIPAPAEVFLYLLISLLSLLFMNVRQLWSYFTNDVLASKADFNSIVSGTPWLQKVTSAIYQSRLLQVLFWLFMGCAVYVLIWFLGNIYNNVRNDFVADSYIHPNDYDRKRFWESVVGRKVFFVIIVVLTLAYLLTVIRIMPLLGGLCRSAVQNFSWNPGLPELIGSWVAIAIFIYIFVFLLRLSVNAWKLIFVEL